MPQVLDSSYAIRVMYTSKGHFKLQYRVYNEVGEVCWITAPIVNDKGDPIGYSVEAIIETGTNND